MVYGIKDMSSCGHIIAWVSSLPETIEGNQYVCVDDEFYDEFYYRNVWFGDDGSWTTEKPYTYKYHYLDNGRWRLDHDKVNLHISQTKDVFSNNLKRYVDMGLEELVCNYVQQQINDIETLDDVEEFALIKFGGKYEAIYNYRYCITI
ncbi:hypothetical protein [Gallibacterium anatis]|uniref:hypothetical protein n=1 Tax=Gallibacterium anatis TaxID=750 RepID=UPI0030059F16